VPVLVYEKNEYLDNELIEGFLNEVKMHFKNWEIPRRIVSKDVISRTANGKVLRELNPL
jgi:acyl-CoA synthetase (AMP-forming)/AMP-acid ligase II